MKRIAKLAILAAAPVLMAALWMDVQPSYRAYKAPVLTPPTDSVPVTGKETITREDNPHNPIAPTVAAIEQGKMLFEINCAFCHGTSSAQRGPVGLKLNPPPPGLGQRMVERLSDADIFKAITFGFGRMPLFRDKLPPRERWLLVTYLRTRN